MDVGLVHARHPDEVASPCCVPTQPARHLARRQLPVGQPGEQFPRRVIKGGSHLCAPNYCLRYRPAARQAQMIDTSMAHLGFRCVVRTTAPANEGDDELMPDKPNILVIWGDDIGITNLSCYSDGLMGYRTPNIDRIANEGMRFTDSYGEQSCTAGRSSFITGQSVYRTGLSKVGIPGMDIGLQAEDPTIAELLKPLGYATGQFGKNHLGDMNKYLPTVHGFDEFFGNLYHLNAEEEPEQPNWPPAEDFPHFHERFGPRGVIHSWATDEDDTTEDGRFGQVGKAADRGHGPADEEADGDDRRRGARARARLHRAGRRPQRRRSSSGSTRRTCTSARTRSRRASARRDAGSRPTTTR